MKTGTWDTPDINASGERKANELLFLISVITYFSKSLQKIDHKSEPTAGKASVCAHTFLDSKNILPGDTNQRTGFISSSSTVSLNYLFAFGFLT